MLEIHYAPILRWFNLFSVLALWGLALLGGLAYQTEGVRFGLAVMWFMLLLGLGWLATLMAAPYLVQFHVDHLIIQRWLGTKIIYYDKIIAISQSRAFITIKTQTLRLALPKLFANADAQFFQALEIYVPVAKQARAHRLAPTLPIVVKGKISTPLLIALGGMSLLIFGSSTAIYAFVNLTQVELLSMLGMLGFGLTCFGLGVFFIYLLLWTYPYRTTFTTEQITQHFFLDKTIQPMSELLDIQMSYSIRTPRNIPRRLYHLTFTYANRQKFVWTPNEFSFPVDYVEAVESNAAKELTAQLRYAYLSLPTNPSTIIREPITNN